jgi:hypothetical protein
MAFGNALKAYQKRQSFLRDVRAAGVDPRTIEYYETARKEASAARMRYESKLRKKKRGIGGSLRKLGGGGSIEKYRDLAQKARLEVEDLKKGLLSDVKKQGELQAIRRKRKTAVEEGIAAMTRKRGKASLISSPAGGAGFFQRYFG